MMDNKNVFSKTIFGVGYFGEGSYKSRGADGKDAPQYSRWRGILLRCYDESKRDKYSSYADCYVDNRWHNYQYFAEWYDNNFYQLEGERMEIDKDILVKGNKVYSPETCVFVPSKINTHFVSRRRHKGDLPTGVHFDKSRGKYLASGKDLNGKSVFLGRFSTVEEAFYVYKSHKEGVFKQLAEYYKDSVPSKLYKAMLDYSIDIND